VAIVAKTYVLWSNTPTYPLAFQDWRAGHDKSYAVPDLNLVVTDCDSKGQVLSTEHARHGFARGSQEYRLGFVRLKNAAFIEYKDLISEQCCFVRIVRNDHHRRRNFVLQLAQFSAKPPPQWGVQCRERFVEQHKPGRPDEGSRQRHALLLPKRQRGRWSLLKTGEAKPVEPVARSRDFCASRKEQLASNGHMWKQGVILWYVRDAASFRR
jgi:hypothetical protein